VDTEELASLFYVDYHGDRAAFEHAVERHAERSGRNLRLQQYRLEGEDDLCVTAAELPARDPQRLLIVVTGIHGVEGYAGSALARLALSELLLRTDPAHTGLLIVHALNPFGFAHGLRVNRNNVDLNRNCALPGQALFATDCSAYQTLAPILSPKRPVRLGAVPRSQFTLQLLAARARHGETTVRMASLAGQYVDSQGVFWGGDVVQPEVRWFQQLYTRLCSQYREVLLVDLHTGYGERGEAYPLFGRADSPALSACMDLGVQDAAGHTRTYEVHGDLVGYCYKTAKELAPRGVWNGVALEIGTHGLATSQQISDLYTVVLENQLRHHLARDKHLAPRVRLAFRELFNPSAPEWRARALRAGRHALENLLVGRGFLRAA
jgi:predicted deacylase